ncbi:hypothetical protein MP638_006231 [Amoeboaphelidium occidentale]|nr:hypothetical protein MP638_006231 [Amoeboaphelidium occidentale]
MASLTSDSFLDFLADDYSHNDQALDTTTSPAAKIPTKAPPPQPIAAVSTASNSEKALESCICAYLLQKGYANAAKALQSESGMISGVADDLGNLSVTHSQNAKLFSEFWAIYCEARLKNPNLNSERPESTVTRPQDKRKNLEDAENSPSKKIMTENFPPAQISNGLDRGDLFSVPAPMTRPEVPQPVPTQASISLQAKETQALFIQFLSSHQISLQAFTSYPVQQKQMIFLEFQKALLARKQHLMIQQAHTTKTQQQAHAALVFQQQQMQKAKQQYQAKLSNTIQSNSMSRSNSTSTRSSFQQRPSADRNSQVQSIQSVNSTPPELVDASSLLSFPQNVSAATPQQQQPQQALKQNDENDELGSFINMLSDNGDNSSVSQKSASNTKREEHFSQPLPISSENDMLDDWLNF